jgi:hypothetical protein
MTTWLWTFAGTLAIESLVVAALCVGCRVPRARLARWLQVCVATNLLTHPVGTVLLWTTPVDWFVVEVVVVVVEALWYRAILGVSGLRAAAVAGAANVASAAFAILWFAR